MTLRKLCKLLESPRDFRGRRPHGHPDDVAQKKPAKSSLIIVLKRQRSDLIGLQTDCVGHNPALHGVRVAFHDRSSAVAWTRARCVARRTVLCSSSCISISVRSSSLCSSGPNGSGKTTLLRILAGLAPPTFGSAPGTASPSASSRPKTVPTIAYRGHFEALKRDLTVVENLEFHAALWGREPAFDGIARGTEVGQRRSYAGALPVRRATPTRRRWRCCKSRRCDPLVDG